MTITLPDDFLDMTHPTNGATYSAAGAAVPVPWWTWRYYVALSRWSSNASGESWWGIKRAAAALGWAVERVRKARRILLRARWGGRPVIEAIDPQDSKRGTHLARNRKVTVVSALVQLVTAAANYGAPQYPNKGAPQYPNPENSP